MSSVATRSEETVGYIQLLRSNRNFRWLWTGQVISLLGDWFDLIASASLLAVLTKSGTAIGGLFVVRMLAPFLVSPFAGVAADRYNRKWLLLGTDIIRGFTVLGFLLVRDTNDVWLVYVLTAFQMGLSGFFFPSRNAILPEITVKAELGAANAISSVTWSVMLAFGAALGGLFSGVWGVYPSFVLDAATFFLSALFISRIAYATPVAILDSDKTIRAALRQYVDGLRYLRRHLDILFITMLKAANSLFVSGAFQVIQVSIAEHIFVIGDSGGIGLGLMYGAVGVGTGVGPIIVRYFIGDEEHPMRVSIALSYLISASGLLLVSTLVNFPVVILGAFLRGVGTGVMWVFSTQLLLQLTPNDIRGRVFSLEFAMFTLMNAIAAGGSGVLLDARFTVPSLLRGMAVLAAVPATLWMLWIAFGMRSSRSSAAHTSE